MDKSVKQAKIIELILQREFGVLSAEEEKVLNLLIEEDDEDKELYRELINDRQRLIDFIKQQSEKYNGVTQVDLDKVMSTFYKKISDHIHRK